MTAYSLSLQYDWQARSMLSYPTSEPLTACNRKPFLSESYQPVEGLAETGSDCKKLMHISLHFLPLLTYASVFSFVSDRETDRLIAHAWTSFDAQYRRASSV